MSPFCLSCWTLAPSCCLSPFTNSQRNFETFFFFCQVKQSCTCPLEKSGCFLAVPAFTEQWMWALDS